jgi:hypothetical protein
MTNDVDELVHSASAQTRGESLFSKNSMWTRLGLQQTGQSSTYSCSVPPEGSSGMTICSPQIGQTYEPSSIGRRCFFLRFFFMPIFYLIEGVLAYRAWHVSLRKIGWLLAGTIILFLTLAFQGNVFVAVDAEEQGQYILIGIVGISVHLSVEVPSFDLAEGNLPVRQNGSVFKAIQ